jgi:hypothetical protein
MDRLRTHRLECLIGIPARRLREIGRYCSVVAPGDQRGARWRAERGGMELRVAQPRIRDAIHGRRRDDAAVRARQAEPRIV